MRVTVRIVLSPHPTTSSLSLSPTLAHRHSPTHTRFDKGKSRWIARRTITAIGLLTTISEIHDPIHRQLIED
jgi:hypothetical protein